MRAVALHARCSFGVRLSVLHADERDRPRLGGARQAAEHGSHPRDQRHFRHNDDGGDRLYGFVFLQALSAGMYHVTDANDTRAGGAGLRCSKLHSFLVLRGEIVLPCIPIDIAAKEPRWRRGGLSIAFLS